MISSLCVAQRDSNELLESRSLRINQEIRRLGFFDRVKYWFKNPICEEGYHIFISTEWRCREECKEGWSYDQNREKCKEIINFS